MRIYPFAVAALPHKYLLTSAGKKQLAFRCHAGNMSAMKLAVWLEQNKIKPSRFAHTIGVAPSTITRLVRGERLPSRELMTIIFSETKGSVRLEDWLDEDIKPSMMAAE